jgi:hypothetical protein
MEGRSYKEIAPILGVSLTALETLLFRARRSLAEELENLVTCDLAELALSQQEDRRLGRKERKRLNAHLEECASCTRVAALAMKRRRAFKGLAVLPLPWSLTFFNGAPTASAAVGLPTIGAGAAGTAAAVGAGGLSAKIAIGFAAVAVASGAGYEGVKAVREPAAPAKAAPAAVVPDEHPAAVVVRAEPKVAEVQVAKAKPKAARVKPVVAVTPVRGRSATAPGQLKKTFPSTFPPAAVKPLPGLGQTKGGPNVKPAPARGKSATAPGRLKVGAAPTKPLKPAKPLRPEKPAKQR